MREVTEKAYGKINLTLNVAGTRPDGFHELETIMQTVDLADTVVLTADGGAVNEPSETGGEITVLSNDPSLPGGTDNLAGKAALLFKEHFGIREGVTIQIEKRIPVAAGMGGGSADAAAVLRGMNRLFDVGASGEDLCGLAAGLGSDIPFLVEGGTAICRGRGEEMEKIASMPDCQIAICAFDFGISTPWSYRRFDELSREKAEFEPADNEAIKASFAAGSLADLPKQLVNHLEKAALMEHPVIEEVKKFLIERGALGSMMTGSGPTVFAIFEAGAEVDLSGLPAGVRTYLTRPLNEKDGGRQ